uniref:Uncharacterized protein n=1 Tax=Rhizophora mucronata TaxID=61149 RepID=A0A2P2MGI7_RHIMU
MKEAISRIYHVLYEQSLSNKGEERRHECRALCS